MGDRGRGGRQRGSGDRRVIARSACVGGLAPGAIGRLSAALADEGFAIEPVERVEGRIDAAVYLDRVHPPGSIETSSPQAWMRTVTDEIPTAFGFIRRVIPRLVPGSGFFVVMTSLAGRIGVPDRTLDAVIAAGLGALAVSLPHEAPGIHVVHIGGTLAPPENRRTQADVTWPSEGAPVLDDPSTLRTMAFQIRCLAEQVTQRVAIPVVLPFTGP